MNDLISRQAAIDALEVKYMSFGIFREQRAASQCIDVIKNLPSAQPEQKVGAWKYYKGMLYEKQNDYHFQCSECKCLSTRASNYCPVCGAEMEIIKQ